MFGNCASCGKCYEHCKCLPLDERIARLAKEEEVRQPLVDEAITLAVKLGVESVEDGFTESELVELENTTRRQHLAVKRLRRRWDRWAEIHSIKHNLENELASDAQHVDSDHVN